MNIESPNHPIEEAIAIESIPSPTLLERMPTLVRREQTAAAACAGTGAPYRLEPLSPSRFLMEFTANAKRHRKITQARNC